MANEKYDPNTLEEIDVLPNGVAMIARINDHIVANIRAGGASRLNLPSQWQEAMIIVTERAPIKTFRIRYERPGFRR